MRLNAASDASIGRFSEATREIIIIARTSLTHLLKEIAGMLDQEMLTNINKTIRINKELFFNKIRQLNFLFSNIAIPSAPRVRRNHLSGTLPASIVVFIFSHVPIFFVPE